MAVGVELLIGEEHHLALEPDPADSCDGGVVERAAQVQAADHRADRGRQELDVEFSWRVVGDLAAGVFDDGHGGLLVDVGECGWIRIS